MGDGVRIDVKFFFQSKIGLIERKRLKQFLGQLLLANGGKKSGELRIIFCSDKDLLKINRKYLNHDYYTDIITFPYSEATGSYIDAELYISTDRVKENAKAIGRPVSNELHRVIFHGCLHLCGFDDKTKKEQQIMRAAESELIEQYYSRST